MDGHDEIPGAGRTAESGPRTRDPGERRPADRTDTAAADPGGRGQADPTDTSAAEAGEQLAELEDRWLRAVADLDNLRKRFARDAERLRAEERDRVAAQWLPVVDNLELALRHSGGSGPVAEGVRAVRDQAVDVLARLGYPRDETTGVRFDPGRHEAVATVDDPRAEPGTVVEVARPGYGELRPAAVVVAAKGEP